MTGTTIHPAGEKLQKAVKEFSYLISQNPNKPRSKIMQEVELKFDLSPKECDFLQRAIVKK